MWHKLSNFLIIIVVAVDVIITEPAHSSKAHMGCTYRHLQQLVRTSHNQKHINRRRRAAVVQIFRSRRGGTSLRLHLQSRHPRRGTSLAGGSNSRRLERQGVRASGHPRSTNRQGETVPHERRLASDNYEVLPSINVALHGLSGTSPVCCTQ